MSLTYDLRGAKPILLGRSFDSASVLPKLAGDCGNLVMIEIGGLFHLR